MKVSLVVASGAHQGKVIPITGPQFLVGRDAQCHLRPASQAISKRHCGVLVRDGQVYIQDFGSTNGTTINDVLVKGAEVLIQDGASLKLGPLDFIVRVEKPAAKPDGTPLPATGGEAAAALAAVKAASGVTPKAPPRDATPNPDAAKRPVKPGVSGGSKEAPALTGSKEAAALKAGGSREVPLPKPAAPARPATQASDTVSDEDHDRVAAMLLGMDDGGTGEVPEGSTVMDVPIPGQGEGQPGAAKPEEKGKKPVQTREDMTNAASDLLRKMMRRPK